MQAEGGLDVVVPTGTVSDVIDTGKSLAKKAQSGELTGDEQTQVIGAGAALLLNPPAVLSHFGLTYVPVGRLELGVRYTTGAWRGGLRWQFLEQDRSGIDVSAGVGVQRFVHQFPVGDVVEILEVNDFKRWSVDVPVLAGQSGSWYRWWAGPRFIYSTFSASLKLTVPNQTPVTASVDGSGVHVGGLGGVALGYRWIFIGFELSVTKLISTAHMQLNSGTQDKDLGSLVIVPGVALMGEF
jgi:hypothetical protein